MFNSFQRAPYYVRLMLTVGLFITSIARPASLSAHTLDSAQVESPILFTPIPAAPKAVAPSAATTPAGLVGAQISYSEATGKARFLRLSPTQATQFAAELAPMARLVAGVSSAQAMGQAFLQRYGSVFGVSDINRQLMLIDQTTDTLGQTHLRYQQVHQGVPVFAGELRVHVNAAGEVQVVNGVFLPDLSINSVPLIDVDTATQRALVYVRNHPPQGRDHTNPTDDATTIPEKSAPLPMSVLLQVAHTQLYVYQTQLGANQPGPATLAYRVEVIGAAGTAVREFVFVDAHNGKIVGRDSAIHEALQREVYDPTYTLANLLWQEGDALPFAGATVTQSLNVNNIITGTGFVYNFFNSTFSRDSYDGAGATMRSANSNVAFACPNAYWDGAATNFCEGTTADDIIAHEWAHAYTERTHGLTYHWQAGALNESYSDIWGEVIDRLNGFGLDSPDIARTDNMCTAFTSGPNLWISLPVTISGKYLGGAADFGPALNSNGITGTVVMAQPLDACSSITNSGAITGNIALVDRGNCSFASKVKNAQDAGAIAVIVTNNASGAPPMGGVDPTITIRSISVEKAAGDLIRGQLDLSQTVVANLNAGLRGTDSSIRWLMGEDSTAFGGAIRDMRNPNCYNQPGKVSDGLYVCSTDTQGGDWGGVHSNSGVPNHAFALLVDGGNYNNQSITGLGLTKAAHIYWRAQTIYQTQLTEFPDHADALEQSCVDLTGQPLVALTTGATSAGISGEEISSADCTQLSKAMAAVEMRMPPAQCGFAPILDKSTPAVCSTGTYPATLYHDTFDADPSASWVVSTTMVDPSTPIGLVVWTWSSALPYGHTGAAFLADNELDNNYSCNPGSDVSRQMYLVSPPITLTAGLTHVLTFDHHIASEDRFDGGIVEISVNHGPFTQVASSNFIFNPYNKLLHVDNPLGSVAGFSGVDGGAVKGSWGQSQINLSGLANSGDVIQLRWDFSTDGCGGVYGWAVDNPQVLYCAAPNQIDIVLSNNQPYTGETVLITATVHDISGTPLSGVNLTGSVSPTVLGSVGVFTPTDLSGRSVATFTAGSVGGVGLTAVSDGNITTTATITTVVPGSCLATPNNGLTVFESQDASAVQQAASVATTGSTVRVAGYCAGVQSINGITQTVYLTTGILLQGGYTRSNWITSNPVGNPTVLDAQKQGRVVYGSTSIALSNMTLKNGDTDTSGGGVFGPRVTLINITLTQNTAGETGGALYASGLATLLNSAVVSNSAGSYGGAIHAAGDVSVRNTRFISNVAGLSGGAIEAAHFVTSTSNLFDQNSAEAAGGGAIHFNDDTEVARMTITGTTFTNNRANQGYGGAVDIDNSNAVMITNSTFISNSAQDGGAVDSDALYPMLVQNSVFTANIGTVYEGGALWVDGDLTLIDSRFVGNRAAWEGGALANWGSSLTVSRSQFIGNIARSGGALMFGGDGARIVNNLFAGNTATNTSGQALHLDAAGLAEVVHNTIVSNSLASGSAIYVHNGSAGVTNTIIVSHSIGISQTAVASVIAQNDLFDGVTVSHTKATGGNATLSNLLAGNASFVNAAAGDYHLSNTSLAVDRGISTSIGSGNDFEGQARPQQAGPDIGMDESPYAIVADLTLSKQASNASALPGQTITYTLVFTNHGPQWISDTLVSDVWPNELTNIVSNTSAGIVPASNQSWRITALAAGAQGVITLTGQISPALTASVATIAVTNTANITHSADANTVDNSSIAVVNVTLPQTSVSDASAAEGNSGQRVLVFSVILSQVNPYAASTLRYATQDGSASAGSDYVASSGTITFAPGQVTQAISISVKGDTQIESDETFTLSLSNPSGVLIAQGTAVGRIVNDDNGIAIIGLRVTSDAPTVLGEETEFTATISTGSQVKYLWDFGDGVTDTFANSFHTYTSVGIFTAIVTASNSLGSKSVAMPVTVTAPITSPVAPSGLSISGLRTGKVGQQMTFTATLLVGTNVTFSWSVNGPVALSLRPESVDVTATTYKYTFTSPGNYTVTVRATNSASALDYGVPISITSAVSAVIPRMYLPITRK